MRDKCIQSILPCDFSLASRFKSALQINAVKFTRKLARCHGKHPIELNSRVIRDVSRGVQLPARSNSRDSETLSLRSVLSYPEQFAEFFRSRSRSRSTSLLLSSGCSPRREKERERWTTRRETYTEMLNSIHRLAVSTGRCASTSAFIYRMAKTAKKIRKINARLINDILRTRHRR